MTRVPSIVVYSSAFCGYCASAKRLLQRKALAYTEIDVLADPSKRSEMVGRSGRTTVPQIFIGDHHVGGCEDLYRSEQSGELDALIAAATNPQSQ